MSMIFTDNIRAYCELNAINIKEFETMTGTANGNVKKWEIGKQTPTLRTMERIAVSTKIPVTTWLKEGAFRGKLDRKRARADAARKAESA